MPQSIVIKRIILSVILVTGLYFAPFAGAQEEPHAFVPTSAWLVGPASLAANIGNISSKIPCVVANQFSNGYVMRFSGGDEKLMALAIDFRQKIFNIRQRYDVEFSVPGAFFQVVSGASYDEGTLVFNLQKIPDFYDAMKKAETLMVKVQGQTVVFAMIGLDDGFERMEVCYNPSIHGPKPLAPPMGPQPTPETQKTPTKHTSIQNPLIAEDARLTPMPDEVATAVVPAEQPQPSGEAEVQTLMEKAKQAGELAQNLAERSPQKGQSAPIDGSRPMAESWSDATAHRGRTDIMVNNGKESPSSEMLWRALKGANLRQVLDIWTRNTGTQFIWSIDQEFVVQKSLSFQGSFEAAIKTLLAQYDGQTPRPQARIEQQPGIGNRVLVIEPENTR